MILSVDTSKIAVGFILSQVDNEGRRRPARYDSIPMNEREANYSQPKLELYGLFRALRYYRIFIIGVKNLQVEVDAKYIKGMLNDSDLQPNATINRWIQGILLFDFKLVHISTSQFKGPDALSRRTPNDDDYEEFDDEFLDNIALHISISKQKYRELINNKVFKVKTFTQDEYLFKILKFLITLEVPKFDSEQNKKRFLKKSVQFFVKNKMLFK